jgi:signal transduction histidine kinase
VLTFDSREASRNADLKKLFDFFSKYSEDIYRFMQLRLRQGKPTPYKLFISEHPEGQKRSRRFLEAFEGALRGNMDDLFKDQQRIGYKRAIEGYKLKDVFAYKMVFSEIIWHFIDKYNSQQGADENRINLNDIRFIERLINYSNYLLSYSFLKTRDEIIARRRTQLHQLHLYATKVVSVFNKEQLRSYVNKGLYDIFGLDGSFLIPYSGNSVEGPSISSHFEGLQISIQSVEKTAVEVARTKEDMAVDATDKMIPFNEKIEENHFKVVCVAMRSHNFYETSLFFVHDQGRAFEFTKFDKNLLYQFAYFTGSVLSNSAMVSELANKQHELSTLAGHLFTIQEEERKRIAADIHDTITQALTAIGYKTLLCQELLDKDPSRLLSELNRLVSEVNEALKQSRQITGNLRPRILDDLGIVAAFKKVALSFKEDSEIPVTFRCPERLTVSPEIGITVIRILQEALNNVKRHAQATKVEISLTSNGQGQLCLLVKDNGQGISTGRHAGSPPENSGLGLLIMRERAEDLGGTFEITSQRGKGCQLRLVLPL